MIEVYHLNDEAFFKDKIEVYRLNDEAFFKANGDVIIHSEIEERYYNANLGFNRERQTEAVVDLFNEGYYLLVAKVDTNSLEHAWERTNHIDGSWQKNDDVQAMTAQARSSKVGDVMKDENGKYHIVASVGFTPILDGLIVSKKKKNKP